MEIGFSPGEIMVARQACTLHSAQETQDCRRHWPALCSDSPDQEETE